MYFSHHFNLLTNISKSASTWFSHPSFDKYFYSRFSLFVNRTSSYSVKYVHMLRIPFVNYELRLTIIFPSFKACVTLSLWNPRCSPFTINLCNFLNQFIASMLAVYTIYQHCIGDIFCFFIHHSLWYTTKVCSIWNPLT